MSTEQLNDTVIAVAPLSAEHTADLSTTIPDENIAPTIQRVKSSNLLRTSPIIPAETKKRKRGADEDDYANAFTDTTNIHSNGDAPLSPGESPTKKRKKLTDEEKAERERQRLEREEKRQQELKEKAERKLKKEEERKQREEERKQKEAEREEQRRQREEEKKRKEEEKKKKEEDKEKQRLEREEEKRKKEEERKKKEDEKKKKEEEKKKKEEEKERAEEEKKRQAEKKKAYWGQFKAASSEIVAASSSLQSSHELAAQSGERGWSTELFRAWQPAVSAVIAPLHRWQSRDSSSFENQLAAQNVQVSIATLPKRARVTRRSVLTARRARRTSHYQQVIDLSGAADPQLNPLTDRLLHARFKYLNFHENVRPAYYGTCTAQCRRVTGRRPFSKDESVVGDYEYDSDEDWEEEEGEDLDALSDRSEEEPAQSTNKEETEEDYCYDGEFLVADGYLSDEEGLKSDNEDDETERDPLISPADLPPKSEEERARDAERRQERMKKMMAHKKRVAECQAVVAGPIYHPSSAEERVRALITCYPVELLAALPIDPRVPLAEELDEEQTSVTATPNKAKVVPYTLVPDLIRILHGASSRTHVIDTFHKLHPHISKRQIERKIVEIASRGQVDDRQGWVVRPEIVARYTNSTSEVLPNLEVKQERSGDTSTAQSVDSPSSAVVDTCHREAMIQ